MAALQSYPTPPNPRTMSLFGVKTLLNETTAATLRAL